MIGGVVCSDQQQQCKSPIQAMVVVTAVEICKDWVVMGRWSSVHNSNMNKLKAEIARLIKWSEAR